MQGNKQTTHLHKTTKRLSKSINKVEDESQSLGN